MIYFLLAWQSNVIADAIKSGSDNESPKYSAGNKEFAWNKKNKFQKDIDEESWVIECEGVWLFYSPDAVALLSIW